MSNIIMIGMPGVGKSTSGVVLAKTLGMDFIDSDLLIQNKYNLRLMDIIEKYGADGFREIEGEVNSSINVDNSVIATGGSAVYHEGAMRHLKEIGTVLYLRISYENLDSRLGDLNERGVVHEEGQTLLDIYNERSVLYEKYADITVDIDGDTVADTIDKIKSKLNKEL